MRVKDLMRSEVQTIHQDETVESLMDLLIGQHIHGVPVVDDEGVLVGIATQQDLLFGTMTLDDRSGSIPEPRTAEEARRLSVRQIMTSPALFADEETELTALCRMMFKLRIHRVPVIRDDRVIGIVSSLDVCGAVARGQIRG